MTNRPWYLTGRMSAYDTDVYRFDPRQRHTKRRRMMVPIAPLLTHQMECPTAPVVRTVWCSVHRLVYGAPRDVPACKSSSPTLWDSCHMSSELLCVSCPSATDFSAILFLLLARSSSNSPRSFQRFRRILVLNSIQIRLRVKNFPIDPHCKNCPLSATLQRCRKRAIFTMWVNGEIIYP